MLKEKIDKLRLDVLLLLLFCVNEAFPAGQNKNFVSSVPPNYSTQRNPIVEQSGLLRQIRDEVIKKNVIIENGANIFKIHFIRNKISVKISVKIFNSKHIGI